MNMQKVTEEFNLVNILIYVVLYLVIIGFFVGFYTLPLIKTFKISQAEYKNNLKHYHSLLNRYEYLKKSFEKKKKENIEIIKKFRHKFDENDFVSFSKNYFSASSLTKKNDNVKKDKNEKFIVKWYKMNFSFLDIKKFYSFINNLKNYSSIVKITFPVVLEKKDNDKHISGLWNLEIYETNSSI